MPELPDVAGFRRFFDTHAAGGRVQRVTAPDAAVIRNTSPQGLGRALHGRRLAEARRHGKWLIAPTDDGPSVVFHFAMTGLLDWADAGGERHEHDRVVFVLDAGELRYRAMRKLGGVWLARGDDDIPAITGPLGPDALSLGRDRFSDLLSGRRGGVKSALMDQSLLAGAGNLVADEALWQAHTHPARSVADLSEAELAGLHDALQRVLEASVEAGHVPGKPSWLTRARDADDPTCPRCDSALRRDKVAGRSTWWCPTCQPQP